MGFICRICNDKGPHKTYSAKEMMFGTRDVFTYFQCNNCGCLQIDEFPQNIQKYYPDDYYSLKKFDGKKFKGIKGWWRRKTTWATINGGKSFLGDLTRKLFPVVSLNSLSAIQIAKETSILDVGCGNGHKFLYPLAELGFNRLLGCDPFITEAIHYANGLSILKQNIFNMEGKWDVITYHHSFEHIPNPQEHLNQVAKLLSPQGVCIIRIPTVSSVAWRFYKTDWVQLDAPRHYFLHSHKSMELLAKDHGLRISKIIGDSTHFQFSGSQKYQRGIPLARKEKRGLIGYIKWKFQKNHLQKVTAALNKKGLSDQAAYYLVKA